MEKDFTSSCFFSDNERYADIINGIGCEGIPFVKGKDLQEMDTKINLGRFMRRGGKGEKESVQRFTAENILWNQFCNHRN